MINADNSVISNSVLATSDIDPFTLFDAPWLPYARLGASLEALKKDINRVMKI